jgi:ABC-type multidrug transport system ATPase subunit
MIRELNRHGTTFLIVEHNMPFVLDLCEPIHVLARGRQISTGTPDEIQADPAVIDAYLGEDFIARRSVTQTAAIRHLGSDHPAPPSVQLTDGSCLSDGSVEGED